MKHVHLKVKRHTLAEEAHYIRALEKKWSERAQKAKLKQKTNKDELRTRESLYHHRKFVIAPEARISHLANAFLMGIPYEKVERSFNHYNFFVPNRVSPTVSWTLFWRKVVDTVYRFHPNSVGMDKTILAEHIWAWRDAHPLYKEELI